MATAPPDKIRATKTIIIIIIIIIRAEHPGARDQPS